jgi:hypothetical protein
MEKVSTFGKPDLNRDGFEIESRAMVGKGSQAAEKIGAGDGI